MGFISTTTLTPGEQMIRRIQAMPVRSTPTRRPFETVIQKRDCQCRQCGRIYPNTKREFCGSCGTATVEAI